MLGTNKIKSENILAEIAKGNRYAFESFYNMHYKKVYTFCFRHLKSTEIAEEILQDVFMKIWTMEEELLKIQNIEAYLKVVSKNRCFDYMRKMAREEKNRMFYETLKIKPVEDFVEDAAMYTDTIRLLQEGVSCLSKQQKLVFELCHDQGLKYDEAAKILNLSSSTVKHHMIAARRFLRQYIKINTLIIILYFLFSSFFNTI